MNVYAIIASFQGVIDGVVFASTSYVGAKAELGRLIREQVVLLRGESTKWWSDEDVQAEYGAAVENCAKVTEYFMDGFEVEG